MNILLGVTGSVAATLTPRLVNTLSAYNFASGNLNLQIVATKPSLYFWQPDDVVVPVWHEADEWPEGGYHKDDAVPHIELRKWADVLLIAPLTANTLAKLAHGLVDNLLTSVARAWDMTKPIIIAPAMNTFMWQHPATAEHLATLKRWYPRLTVIDPVEKTLACGDHGIGAMAPIDVIIDTIMKL